MQTKCVRYTADAIGERLDTQMRINPEFFGDVPRDEHSRTGFGSLGNATATLPGVPEHDHEGWIEIFLPKRRSGLVRHLFQR